MNKVILLGRLTRDVELRYSQSSEPLAVGRFALAVDRRINRERRDAGEQAADFISCVAFGKTAENIEKFFGKGRMIAVEGRIQTGRYEKDGHTVYTTDVVVESFSFTGEKREDMPQNTGQQNGQQNGQYFVPDEGLDDDDLPF